MDEITKSSLKQTGKILVSVSPLVALWLIAWGHSLIRLQIGIYVGTALLISIIVARYAHGAILWAMIRFFVLALILGAWLKNLWFIRHLGVFPGGMLFTAAMLSMVLDRPLSSSTLVSARPPARGSPFTSCEPVLCSPASGRLSFCCWHCSTWLRCRTRLRASCFTWSPNLPCCWWGWCTPRPTRCTPGESGWPQRAPPRTVPRNR